MKIGNRVFGLICLGLSVWLVIEALRYDYTTKYTPGPGFAPFWVGVLLGLFSIYLIADSFVGKWGEKEDKPVLPERASLQRIVLIILALIVYTAVLMPLGFLLSTAALVFILLYYLEEYTLVKSIVYSAMMGGGTFLLFNYWMDVELPRSFLGLGF
jgi:putative tricarboxylic transport membrane protein